MLADLGSRAEIVLTVEYGGRPESALGNIAWLRIRPLPEPRSPISSERKRRRARPCGLLGDDDDGDRGVAGEADGG